MHLGSSLSHRLRLLLPQRNFSERDDTHVSLVCVPSWWVKMCVKNRPMIFTTTFGYYGLSELEPEQQNKFGPAASIQNNQTTT